MSFYQEEKSEYQAGDQVWLSGFVVKKVKVLAAWGEDRYDVQAKGEPLPDFVKGDDLFWTEEAAYKDAIKKTKKLVKDRHAELRRMEAMLAELHKEYKKVLEEK